QIEAAPAQAQAALDQLTAAIAEAQAAIETCDEGIAAAEQTIASLQEQLAQIPAKEELERAKTQLTGAIAAIEALGEEATPEQLAQLEQLKGRLDQVEGALEGRAQLEAGIAQAEAGKQQAEAGKAQAEAGLAQAQAGLEQAQAALAQAQQAQEQLPGLRAQLDELKAQRAQVDEGLAGLDELADAKRTLDASQAELDAGKAQLDDGQAKLDAGRKTLAASRRTAESELAKAKAQLDDAAAELADARGQLADAREQYADGLAEYEDGKAEAEEEFSDALDQLNDAQREIDEIELPDIYALDRTQSEGAATYHADAGRIDSIADVFPFIFFLVAALVALTTMTRMVDDDRVLIGTYKALGYSTGTIASKYLVYAGVAGVAGATIGILALSQVLPFIVTSAYSIIYTIPLHPFPLPVSPGIALMSGGLGVGVTLLATWGAVVSSLREVPATLMLPRAPVAGKRILLERVRPIWQRLSFTWKVTCRNLFRYKRRFLMTVIGISGCAALLLVGFGLHDSIWDIIDRQYGPIIHFDTTIGLDDNAIELDVRRAIDYLESTGEVDGIVRVQNENMQAGAAGTDETIRVNTVIPRDAGTMDEVITFKNRVSGKSIELTDDSVVITEKLALKYDLAEGDAITLFDQDDVGNAVGDGHELTVTGVAENYVGNVVYVGRDAWRQV
ncbi:MAG: ABC transporter permease, partial [Atopobiaceae bacterium]|nr:ABC transporter permease [Atopobiaceae bacterium]